MKKTFLNKALGIPVSTDENKRVCLTLAFCYAPSPFSLTSRLVTPTPSLLLLSCFAQKDRYKGSCSRKI